ncbi:MAG: DUF4292 domain-containing protein [Cyclobacteriaceae bacterium]|nr:DUF4292 domain-containing protein [Cyclobacteriaceae bacterium]
MIKDTSFEGGLLEVNEVDFIYFSGKTKIEFKDEDYDINAKANIRIRKDSVIWMTFSSAGITGGKCLIDQDSITIVNTLKNEYYVFTYKELTEQFNFDINYKSIQAAALGNLIMTRQPSDRASKRDQFIVLNQTSGNVKVNNFINNDTHKIEKVDMKETPSNNIASIDYSDFQWVNDQYLPFKGIISIIYKTSEETLNTKIEFEYSKAEITDKPLRFPFKIPRKYERK